MNKISKTNNNNKKKMKKKSLKIILQQIIFQNNININLKSQKNKKINKNKS